MADETVHEITDEELSAAYREEKARRESLLEMKSQVAEPDPEPPDEVSVDDPEQVETDQVEDVGVEPTVDDRDDVPDEPIDQAARSKLGRNVAELRRQNEVLQAELYAMRQQFDRYMQDTMSNPQAPAAAVQPKQKDPYGYPLDYPLDQYDTQPQTPATQVIDENYIGKIIEQRESKLAAARDQYMNNFAHRIVMESKSDDPGLVSEIEKYVTENYGVFDSQKTGDPVTDARIVYNQAKATVLSTRLATQANMPKQTLKQERPKPGTLGGGHSSVNDGAGRKATPKLDPKAQAAAEKMGLTPEEIDEYMKRPDPLRQAVR